MKLVTKKLFDFFIKCFFIVIAAIMGIFLLLLIIVGRKSVFSDEFTGAMALKYRLLKETESPKIIIIGGSNAAFGIDSNLLQEYSGYPVVNLGLHAGLGQLFNTELAKEYIHEGDIVLLAYEYCFYKDAFDGLGDIDLIMMAIDNNIEMYRAIPLKEMPVVFGNLFHYLEKKVTKDDKESGIYSIESFDQNGNMILEREEWIVPEGEAVLEISDEMLTVTENNIEYLQKLAIEIKNKNAKVYFIAPPILKDGLTASEESLRRYKKQLEDLTQIRYISDPEEYVFSKKEMFDTSYHCNSRGERKRTQLLIRDLEKEIKFK